MKYKEATENPDQYFSNVKFVNLSNIRQLIKMNLMDTTKNLRMKWLVQLIDPNVRTFFLKNIHIEIIFFFEKYPHTELSAIKKDLKKNKTRPL